jgi:hypothetical protein
VGKEESGRLTCWTRVNIIRPRSAVPHRPLRLTSSRLLSCPWNSLIYGVQRPCFALSPIRHHRTTGRGRRPRPAGFSTEQPALIAPLLGRPNGLPKHNPHRTSPQGRRGAVYRARGAVLHRPARAAHTQYCGTVPTYVLCNAPARSCALAPVLNRAKRITCITGHSSVRTNRPPSLLQLSHLSPPARDTKAPPNLESMNQDRLAAMRVRALRARGPECG